MIVRLVVIIHYYIVSSIANLYFLFIMQAMQRDYKLSSYSLNSVSAHFLGEQVRRDSRYFKFSKLLSAHPKVLLNHVHSFSLKSSVFGHFMA